MKDAKTVLAATNNRCGVYVNSYTDEKGARWYQIMSAHSVIFPLAKRKKNELVEWWASLQDCESAGFGDIIRTAQKRGALVDFVVPF